MVEPVEYRKLSVNNGFVSGSGKEIGTQFENSDVLPSGAVAVAVIEPDVKGKPVAFSLKDASPEPLVGSASVANSVRPSPWASPEAAPAWFALHTGLW